MKLIRTCLLAATSLVVILPGAAFASFIYSGQLLDKAHAPGFSFSTDSSAKGNVLGTADEGGKYLNLGWAATSQSYIKLRMEQAITQDGTSTRDLRIINFSEIAKNSNQAAAIWVVVDGVAYNIGSNEVVRDVAKGISGVWDSPTGKGTTYRDRGWIVFGGSKGGKIDLDFFFGESGIYGKRENLAISDIYISGYNQNGLTTQSYDLDTVKAFNEALIAPVPVPAAVWLFISGLAGLIAVGRQRNA